jgi:protein-S-isoprenylcysteine O-methyltransferase Ste14
MDTAKLVGQDGRSSLLAELRRGTKAYDLMAAIPLVVLYGVGAIEQFRQIGHNLAAFQLAQPDFTLTIRLLSQIAVSLFSLLIIVLLFARTPPKGSARGLAPRAMAFLGTYLMTALLLLPRRELAGPALTISTAFVLGGMAFAVYALFFLGRSISVMAEARRLVTGGPYAMVRHPLYLGEEIAAVGAVMRFFSSWAILILVLQIACQLYRMHCEEQILADTFPEYGPYKARTFRILPYIY